MMSRTARMTAIYTVPLAGKRTSEQENGVGPWDPFALANLTKWTQVDERGRRDLYQCNSTYEANLVIHIPTIYRYVKMTTKTWSWFPSGHICNVSSCCPGWGTRRAS